MDVKFTAIELDQIQGGGEMQEELQKMTGQRTVPNIFVKGKHLGGCDDTLRAEASGELKKMLG
jgi:glutaredoxin